MILHRARTCGKISFAEIGLLCGFCFNVRPVRQLNLLQFHTRPLSASAASAGLSNQQMTGVLR
jgi:hypothetical protein